MKHAQTQAGCLFILAAGLLALPAGAQVHSSRNTFTFRHHLVTTNFPMFKGTQPAPVGDYGSSGLADFDGDGDLDFTMARPSSYGPSTVYWLEYQKPDRWLTHIAGRDTVTSVGGAVMDVDQDGWVDIVHGGAYYRNTGKPRTEEFQRHVFDPEGGSVHDVVIVDVNGDRQQDVVTLSESKGLHWYRMPGFHKQRVADGVHGGVGPQGVGDLDGDGDTDLVRANVWLENLDGKGLNWAEHPIPFGKTGPYGMSARSWVADLDGDADLDMVLGDCDRYGEATLAWLENADGRARQWIKHELGLGVDYHALAVADFDRDGDLDIFAGDAEVTNPPWRWWIWANSGGPARRFVQQVIFDAGLGVHEPCAGDVDGDGDFDLVSKPWASDPKNAVGGFIHVDFLENLHLRPGAP